MSNETLRYGGESKELGGMVFTSQGQKNITEGSVNKILEVLNLSELPISYSLSEDKKTVKFDLVKCKNNYLDESIELIKIRLTFHFLELLNLHQQGGKQNIINDLKEQYQFNKIETETETKSLQGKPN